jgi:gliding motility-associated-like protein
MFRVLILLLFFYSTKLFAQCNGNDTLWTIDIDSACAYRTTYSVNSNYFNSTFSIPDQFFAYGNASTTGKRAYINVNDTFNCIQYGDTISFKTRLTGLNYNNFPPSIGLLFKTNLFGGGNSNVCGGITSYHGTIITNNQCQIYGASSYLAGYKSQIELNNFSTNPLSNSWHNIKYFFNQPDAITAFPTVSVLYDDSLMHIYSLGVSPGSSYRAPLFGLPCSLFDFKFYFTAPFEIDYFKITGLNGIEKYNEDFTSCNTLSRMSSCNNGNSISLTYSSPTCVNNQLQLNVLGTGFSNFNWTGPNNFTSNAQNPIIPNPIAGTYTVTATPSNTCFAPIVKTQQVVFSKSYTPKFTTASICEGQSILLEGALQTTAGIYKDTIVTTGYCDTIKFTTLTIKPKKYTTVNASICQGQTYQGYTLAGTYTNTFLAQDGCDSIVTLILSYKPNSFSTIAQSICQGQTYLGYSVAGIYKDTLVATNGCDSIRTLLLTVNPKSFSTINQTICQGQNYLGYTTTGFYSDTLMGTNGCDSIRTLNLTVKAKSFSTITQSICEGQNYAGHTTTGTYTDTYTAANVCDSVRTLNLIVKARTYFIRTINICQGENYFAGGTLQTTSGTYRDTAINVQGCDSVITTILNVRPLPQPNLGPDKSICQGQILNLNPGNFTSYIWQDASTNPTFAANTFGEYRVEVKNAFNCKASDTMYVLNVYPNPVGFLAADTSFCRGNTIYLTPYNNYNSYVWSTGATTKILPVTNYGTYNLKVTDANNCFATESIIVKRANCTSLVWPNAFSPNGDGNNDVFKPRVNEPVTNYTLQIWNRWGQLIFTSNNPSQGWDGTINGTKQPIGTYIYTTSYTDLDNKKYNTSGEISLIK